MILLAIIVLPVLGFELLLQSVSSWVRQIPNFEMHLSRLAEADAHFVRLWLAYRGLDIAVGMAIVFIWLAFFVEFVVKIAIAPSRAGYARKNWLDIVIILLPMLRPVRSIRALRALRLARMLRVLTLRGVAMKLVRTGATVVLGTRAVQRVQRRFGKPRAMEPGEPDCTTWSRAALLAEVHRLRECIREMERKNTPSE